MNIAYLVLAHKNPLLLARQIALLTSAHAAFHIHIDAKADIRPFVGIRGNNVFFSPSRLRVYWAEYSMIEAILLLMRQALAARQRYDYFVLLSGSDYPLRSRSYISDFLERNNGSDFISLVPIAFEDAGIPLSKITNFRAESNRPVLKLATRVAGKLGIARRDIRKHLGSLVPCGGSTWWTLTRRSCEYILHFVDRNECVCDFFRGTFAPDETLFHTVLGNGPFRSRIKRCLMYDDWLTVGANPAHPAYIGEEHLRYFAKSRRIMFEDVFGSGEMLFARKFSDDNLAVVRRVEEMIESVESPHATDA